MNNEYGAYQTLRRINRDFIARLTQRHLGVEDLVPYLGELAHQKFTDPENHPFTLDEILMLSEKVLKEPFLMTMLDVEGDFEKVKGETSRAAIQSLIDAFKEEAAKLNFATAVTKTVRYIALRVVVGEQTRTICHIRASKRFLVVESHTPLLAFEPYDTEKLKSSPFIIRSSRQFNLKLNSLGVKIRDKRLTFKCEWKAFIEADPTDIAKELIRLNLLIQTTDLWK